MEDSNKFTKGPWVVGQYGNSFVVTAKGNQYDVAVVRNIGNEDNEANARLIAAAPDLLEAAQRVDSAFASYPFHSEALIALRAAISRALGA